jgi:hypothetical protein
MVILLSKALSVVHDDRQTAELGRRPVYGVGFGIAGYLVGLLSIPRAGHAEGAGDRFDELTTSAASPRSGEHR